MSDRDQSRQPDSEWDRANRHETETERLDRNWNDLLQELRVAQTGVQLLTGFLLTLPFQQRFKDLDDIAKYVYLATVGASVAATGVLVAPVAIHRLLFRQHARRSMVGAGHACALAGLALLGVATCGAVYVVTTLVVDDTAGVVAVLLVAIALICLWVLLPLLMRRRE